MADRSSTRILRFNLICIWISMCIMGLSLYYGRMVGVLNNTTFSDVNCLPDMFV